jgi:transcription elongation factor Elf1
MTQSQLDHAIAHYTGESLETIRCRGFRTRPVELEPEDLVLALDCPFCGRTVVLDTAPGVPLPAVAECDRCDVYFEYRADELYAVERATV